MRLLVTGGAGFIGSNFVRFWADRHPDDGVVAYDVLTYAGNRPNLADLEDRISFVEGDIGDLDTVAKTLEDQQIDVIVNFAAESHNSLAILDPTRFFQTNVMGTQTLLEAARRHGVSRFHHISTCEVYGDLALDSDERFTEETAYRPRTPYNASKAGADHAVRAYVETFGVPATITNCCNNYGPYQFPEKVIPLFAAKALDDQPLTLYASTKNRREWLHVDDHCRAIEAVLSHGELGETYNVGSGIEASIEEVADAVLAATGRPSTLKEIVPDRPSHDRRYLLDSAKIRRALGWEPTIDFAEGLAQFRDYALHWRFVERSPGKYTYLSGEKAEPFGANRDQGWLLDKTEQEFRWDSGKAVPPVPVVFAGVVGVGGAVVGAGAFDGSTTWLIVAGAVAALRENNRITKLYLVGDRPRVETELRKLGASDNRLELIHASEVITMDDPAVAAVRRKKDSSMCRAIDLVKQGDADAIVSAGNTGALLTAAHLKLRTLEGVERPGLAVIIPAPKNIFVLLDAGANLEPHPSILVQYAIMGSLYSKQILGYKQPRVAVFSIGTEDMKGNELTLEAHRLLKQTDLNFVGNIDGHDLFSNRADVIVTDAFVGNAVLKACESTARLVGYWLKEEIRKNPLRMLGAALAAGAFKALKRKADPDEYGGAVLLGINGICVKAHGASSPNAAKNAIRVATEFIECQFNDHIVEETRKFHDKIQQNQFAQPPIEAAS